MHLSVSSLDRLLDGATDCDGNKDWAGGGGVVRDVDATGSTDVTCSLTGCVSAEGASMTGDTG